MLTGDFTELNRFANGLASTREAFRAALNSSAPKIQSTARAGYASGEGPTGQKWEPKADGSLAMQGPASKVTFKASGDSIVGEAPDVFEYHLETRPVFPPDGQLPDAWGKIIEDEVASELKKVLPQ